MKKFVALLVVIVGVSAVAAGAVAAPVAARPAVAKKAKKGGKPSAGRLRQIVAMKAFWAKKKAAKVAPAKHEAAAK